MTFMYFSVLNKKLVPASQDSIWIAKSFNEVLKKVKKKKVFYFLKSFTFFKKF